MLTWVGVACFGALGAVARFRLDSAVSARLPSDFPLGTLVVNLTGSFALGVLVGASVTDRIAFLLGTGFTGGYTTFSTWMVESERLDWLIRTHANIVVSYFHDEARGSDFTQKTLLLQLHLYL